MKTFGKIAIMMLAFMVIVPLGEAGLNNEANAQTWNWSPKANHHAAACMITCRMNDGSIGGTTGTLIEFGNVRGVITCAHGLGVGEASVKWKDGTVKKGRWTTDKFGHDVAFIFVDNPNVQPVKLATSGPRQGDIVEFVTFGGPEDTLRHWTAPVSNLTSRMTEFSTYVISGDSGGGILNKSQELVGVQSVGLSESIRRDWNVYRGAGAASFASTHAFMGRVAGTSSVAANQQCVPGYCPPRQFGPQQGGFYPPQQPSQPQQPPPQVQPPAQQPQEVEVQIDYQKLAGLVRVEMEKNPEPFRGPPGKDGTNGSNGKDGKDGQPGTPGLNGGPGLVAVELTDGNGQTVDSISVGPDGVLRLPPVRMQIQHPGGQVFEQSKPLGRPIAIKLVPKEK